MKNFKFRHAQSVTEALEILDELKEQAYLVAGATNAMVDIRAKKRNDLTLVNIRDLTELKGIRIENGRIIVGALTTIAELAKSEILKEHATALYMAANVFADPTTRNSATIGGNCVNASPAADTAPALLVLNALVHVRTANSERVIAAEQFFIGVNKTALMADELVTAFSFAPTKSAFLKIGLRNAMAISVATAAAAVTLDDSGTVTDCRLAFGSVAPKPIRSFGAESALIGLKLDDVAFDTLASAVNQDICPIDDIRATGAYRREVTPVLAKRALSLAAFGKC